MTETEDVRCTFCGVDHAHARKLVSGFGVVLCDACVMTCRHAEKGLPESIRVVQMQPAKLARGPKSNGLQAAEACTFCDQPPTSDRRLFAADTASICTDCIVLCEGIYQEEIRRWEAEHGSGRPTGR